MKFGIFYELQLPRPWVEGDELRLYQNALTQLETADRVGYDYAWVVEHHFLEEYSHSPAPESFLAAASQRTKRIRLGHGIFQLTTNHPARVAERVAVLDLLSNGRCEFGMGESASITELTPFGRDMETKREVFEEAVAAIFPMFTRIGTEHHGKYFDIPLRNVVPKPVQKPHPPIYFSGLRDPARSASRISKYNLAGWIGIQDTPEEVQNWRGAIQQELGKLESSRSIDDLDIGSMIWYTITDQESDQTPRGKGTNLLVGTAAQVTDNLKRLKEAGLNLLLIWPPFADVPVSKTLDDLKRLKEEIMPKVEAA